MIKIESYKKGALLSIIFNGSAKGVLFFLTIIIAHFFGSNIKTDIYFFIYTTMILFAGFINAVDIAVLIPTSMRIRQTGGPAAAMGFLNYFLRIYIIMGIAFVSGMFFLGTSIFGLISKFSDADILLYRNYFLLGSFYFLFQVLTNYINNILTSIKFFTMPMIISCINSCIIIAGIILLHYQLDVLSVLISGVVAYLINLTILLVVLKRTLHWNFASARENITRKTWSNILYTELGQFATLISSYFPLYLLSGFSSGLISSMSYGKNIADVPNTLITAQLSNVSGIKLNEDIARNDNYSMNDTFVRTSKLMVFLLVPVGFFLFVFAAPIVEIFYNKAGFNAAAISETITFLQLLSVTVFSIAVNSLVSRLFIAAQAIKQAFIYQLIMNALLIISTWLLVKYYGAFGYGYAVIVINIVNYFFMFFICKILIKEIDYAAVLKYTGLVILLNGVIAGIFYFANAHIEVNAWVKVASAAVIWLIVLLLCNKAFHVNKDISALLKIIKNYVR